LLPFLRKYVTYLSSENYTAQLCSKTIQLKSNEKSFSYSKFSFIYLDTNLQCVFKKSATNTVQMHASLWVWDTQFLRL